MFQPRFLRTDSDNPDYRILEKMLDDDLNARYGEAQQWYNQFNTINDKKPVVLAYVNDQLAGCGCFREYENNTAEIKRMFVKPEFRGTIVAETILLELENWAAEQGYSEAVLETAVKQPEAIRFYTRMGYSRIGNYGQYAGDENSVCMWKLLVLQAL